MHIIMGILGSLITVLILLNRLADAGIDLGGMNPYLWHRRRKWRKTYQGEPIFKIDNPMELAALLVIGVAKSDGDISSEEKHKILELFEKEFHLSKSDATGLMSSSVYLLGRGDALIDQMEKVVQPSKDKLTDEQITSVLDMLHAVAKLESSPNERQQQILQNVARALKVKPVNQGKW